jgi:hypothetical protein
MSKIKTTIDLNVITPKEPKIYYRSFSQYTEEERKHIETTREKYTNDCAFFEKIVVDTIGLGSNWNRYFRFNYNGSFIVLQSNGYNATIYRKFSKDKNATIPVEIKNLVLESYQYKEEDRVALETAAENEKQLAPFVTELKEKFGSEEITLRYDDKQGLIVILNQDRVGWYSEVTRLCIGKDGVITTPLYDIKYSNKLAIKQIAKMLEQFNSFDVKINQVANDIKQYILLNNPSLINKTL